MGPKASKEFMAEFRKGPRPPTFHHEWATEMSLRCAVILSQTKHCLLFCILPFHLAIIIFYHYYLLFYLLRSPQVSFRFTTEETLNQSLRYNKPSTTPKHTIHSIFSFCCTTSGQSPQYHMKKPPHVGLDTGATALKWRICANTSPSRALLFVLDSPSCVPSV